MRGGQTIMPVLQPLESIGWPNTNHVFAMIDLGSNTTTAASSVAQAAATSISSFFTVRTSIVAAIVFGIVSFVINMASLSVAIFNLHQPITIRCDSNVERAMEACENWK